jgi:glyoxylate reductase
MRSTEASRPFVFVTRPIAEQALTELAGFARVDLWDDEMPPPRAVLLERVARADAILTLLTDRIDAAAIAAAPRLRVISNLAVGVDNIDLDAATRAGVAVGHTPGVLTETTADLAFALLMAAARRIVEADSYTRQGRWRTWGPHLMLGRDVFGATLGIVGWGAIGRAMARRAAGFRMRVLYAAREGKAGAKPGPHAAGKLAGARRVSLDELLRESDFVSLHVPLTPETRAMLSGREFRAMKSGAILINTARGEVIDQRALYEALASGHLAAAALDVTSPEPIAPDDPLLSLPNVILTPHIGSASHATRLRMAQIAVANIRDVLAGRLPRYCANPAVRLRKPH